MVTPDPAEGSDTPPAVSPHTDSDVESFGPRASKSASGAARSDIAPAVAKELLGLAAEKAPATPAETHEGLVESEPADTEDLRAKTPITDSIPGYEIAREIHRGGQGVVYLAIQRGTKRKVAIKVMREGPFAGRRDKARFEREVEVLGQLNHSHIVAIHDSGMAAGNFYFVMDYISGQSLDVWMAGKAHSIEEVLGLFMRICEAVNAAHLRGVVHRDLKPGNIRIDAEGEPHILDFGLAKVAAGTEASLMTITGQFVGSLPWASPEQAEGEPSKIDMRTDVYSLGVILYQMLTGRFPYDVVGSMRDVLDRILKAEPARPSTIRKQINDEVETIVLKCLSKERERRYQTAGELARDIHHYLAGEPIEAKRDSTLYVLRKALRRYRAPVAVAAGFVALLAVALVVSIGLWQRSIRQRDRAQAAEAAAARERDLAREQQTLAQRQLFDGLVTVGDSRVTTKQYGEARQAYSEAWALAGERGFPDLQARVGWLGSYVAGPPPLMSYTFGPAEGGSGGGFFPAISVSPDGRLIVFAHGRVGRLVDVLTGREAGVLMGHAEAIASVAFSPDGQSIATGGRDRTVRLWSTANRKEIRRFTGQGPILDCVFTPDGTTVISSDQNGRLIQWDTTNGREIRSIQTDLVEMLLACSPDGKSVVAGGVNVRLVLIDLAAGAVIRRFEGHERQVPAVAFSRDGRRILSGSWDKTVRLWDAATGQEIRRFSGHTGMVNRVAISPDGRSALSTGVDRSVKLWDLDTGEEVESFSGHQGNVWGVDFLPDGRAAVSSAYWQCLLWSLPPPHGSGRTFAEHRGRVNAVVIAPDGRTALSGGADSLVRHWDVASARQIRPLIGHTAPVRCVALLPDGRRAISGSEDNTVRLWDLPTGKELRTFTGHQRNVVSLALSPDGRTALSGDGNASLRLWDLEAGTGSELWHSDENEQEIPLAVAIARDGRTAITAHSGNIVRLWDLGTRTETRQLLGHKHWACSVGFVPDGCTALSGSWDNTMILWERATGKLLRRFTGHIGWVRAIAVSRDGRLAFTGSEDNTIRLWDIGTGKELCSLSRHAAAVVSLALSQDGRVLLAGSHDGTVSIWDLDLPDRYREQEAKLTLARETLARHPTNPAPLVTLGEWYAFREADHLAVGCLENACSAGAPVSPLLLGRCYWRLGRFTDARREFEAALQSHEAPADYLELCLAGVSRAASVPTSGATTQAVHSLGGDR